MLHVLIEFLLYFSVRIGTLMYSLGLIKEITWRIKAKWLKMFFNPPLILVLTIEIIDQQNFSAVFMKAPEMVFCQNYKDMLVNNFFHLQSPFSVKSNKIETIIKSFKDIIIKTVQIFFLMLSTLLVWRVYMKTCLLCCLKQFEGWMG